MVSLEQLDVAHNLFLGQTLPDIRWLLLLQNFTYLYNFFTGEPPECLREPSLTTAGTTFPAVRPSDSALSLRLRLCLLHHLLPCRLRRHHPHPRHLLQRPCCEVRVSDNPQRRRMAQPRRLPSVLCGRRAEGATQGQPGGEVCGVTSMARKAQVRLWCGSNRRMQCLAFDALRHLFICTVVTRGVQRGPIDGVRPPLPPLPNSPPTTVYSPPPPHPTLHFSSSLSYLSPPPLPYSPPSSPYPSPSPSPPHYSSPPHLPPPPPIYHLPLPPSPQYSPPPPPPNSPL